MYIRQRGQAAVRTRTVPPFHRRSPPNRNQTAGRGERDRERLESHEQFEVMFGNIRTYVTTHEVCTYILSRGGGRCPDMMSKLHYASADSRGLAWQTRQTNKQTRGRCSSTCQINTTHPIQFIGWTGLDWRAGTASGQAGRERTGFPQGSGLIRCGFDISWIGGPDRKLGGSHASALVSTGEERST